MLPKTTDSDLAHEGDEEPFLSLDASICLTRTGGPAGGCVVIQSYIRNLVFLKVFYATLDVRTRSV